MNISDAAYATVHDYPGGSESLGPRVGISPAVLRSKVNTHLQTHHLTLAEADRIMGITGDHRILVALAAAQGFALQRLDAPPPCTSLLGAHLAASVAGGALASTLAEAIADGRVTQNESTAIASAANRVQAAMVELERLAYAAAQGQGVRAAA
jgi:hypothetical protein